MKKHSAKKSAPKRTRAKNPDHNPKDVGEAIEALFTYEMKKRGVTLCNAIGDTARFDRVVDRGPQFPNDGFGRFVSVQVRGALRRMRGCYCFHVKTSTGYPRRYFTTNDAAILAAYVAPLEIWYLIPIHLFAPKGEITLYPGIESKKAKYEQWRENWELLCPGRANRNILFDWINRDWRLKTRRKRPLR